jgi:hypothetical protein
MFQGIVMPKNLNKPYLTLMNYVRVEVCTVSMARCPVGGSIPYQCKESSPFFFLTCSQRLFRTCGWAQTICASSGASSSSSLLRGRCSTLSMPDLDASRETWPWRGRYSTTTFATWVASIKDMDLGQAHCLASRAPTLELWLEITTSRKFVIQGFIWIKKF